MIVALAGVWLVAMLLVSEDWFAPVVQRVCVNFVHGFGWTEDDTQRTEADLYPWEDATTVVWRVDMLVPGRPFLVAVGGAL